MVQTNYFMYFNTYDLKYLSNKDWKIIVEFNNYIQKMTANIYWRFYIYILDAFFESKKVVSTITEIFALEVLARKEKRKKERKQKYCED